MSHETHEPLPIQPLPVLFVQTSMPVGGAETLLVNLVRGLDPRRFAPSVVCLKEPGPLGEQLAAEGFPVESGLLRGKYDLAVLPRLIGLMRRRRIAAVVTVGAGDKMFWGRLAARLAGVPVVASALHSTGWPDGVGRLNRLLTPITDAFIAVAPAHGKFLAEFERFPEDRVRVIPNGVDTDRFVPLAARGTLREELGVAPTTPLVGILAALRPEKNHELFLHTAKRVHAERPQTRFVVIGEGPERATLERVGAELGLIDPVDPSRSAVRLLGNRSDIPRLLAALDVLTLTSHNEANPISILEAMSCGVPVVATDVGSVSESVLDCQTGYVVPAGDERTLADRVGLLIDDPLHAQTLGDAGREHVVRHGSLAAMVRGYERLVTDLWESKTGRTLGDSTGDETLSGAATPEAQPAIGSADSQPVADQPAATQPVGVA